MSRDTSKYRQGLGKKVNPEHYLRRSNWGDRERKQCTKNVLEAIKEESISEKKGYQSVSSGSNTDSDQIISVAQLCPTLCDPMNCSTPGLPVYHQLPEFTETLWVY